jgi:hypothetical protein
MINEINNEINNEPVKSKRGRKSKKDLLASVNKVDTQPNMIKESSINEYIKQINNETLNESLIEDEDQVIDKPIKKRGRKPKGGKIVQQVTTSQNVGTEKINVILHLKCFLKDLNGSNIDNIESYNFQNNTDLSYDILSNNNNYMNNTINDDIESDDDYKENKLGDKELWKKIKQLYHNLHINYTKKSACFWDTCDFDNPPIYIPKTFTNGVYEVYGCFCCGECAVAHLFRESIDSSTKFERYHMLNHLYGKPFNYTKNIKPAADPHYMLDKFYGNLSIQEYRSLLKSERLFLIVDKPLTKITPELHEDNDEFILNKKIIPSNNYQLKKKSSSKQTKNNILNEKFGITQ